MTDLKRRIAKLEAVQGSVDTTLVEHELSDEMKQLLREALEGLHSREAIG
jgi:hypothetical protein